MQRDCYELVADKEYHRISIMKFYIYPLILHGRHPLTSLIVHTEHVHLLHTLLSTSLATRYHIVKGRTTIHSVYHQCITCCHMSVKSIPQMMDKLPIEQVTPGPTCMFEKMGVDYTGPMLA